MVSMLDAALAYASAGWHVFPLKPGTKEPSTPSGHLDATIDPDAIRAWWSSSPRSNVGISLEPSGLVVLDVDVAEEKKGAESLVEFDAVLPTTLTQRTGRGGLQALFVRGDVEPRRLIGFREGLDLLGKGYVVAAPSVLTGDAFAGAAPGATGSYAWIDAAVAPAPLPSVLRDVQRERAVSAPAGVDADRAPIGSGGRNDALYRLGAALRDQGLGPSALALALERENLERCRPPMEDLEVAAIVRSVLTRVRPSRDAATSTTMSTDLVASLLKTPVPEADLEPEGELPPLIGAAALTAGPPVRTYATGWTELDSLIGGGVKTRQLLVVTAPPGDGKSALAIEVAGLLSPVLPVLYVSTELEGAELAARKAAPILKRPWTELVSTDSAAAIAEALVGQRIYVIGCDALPMDTNEALGKIITFAQAIAVEHGVAPAIWVDYLQDLARGDEDARAKVGQLAAQLRAIAQVLDCAVLAVCSVSRAYYGAAKAEALRQSEDARVYLATAKESGDVDYAAATVLFLDVAGEASDGQRPCRAAVAKCRHGRAGFAGMRFDGRLGAWKADPGAISEVLSSGESTTAARSAEHEAAAVAKAREMEAAGMYPSRKALEDALKIRRAAAVSAVGAALASGALVQEPVLHRDTHRMTRYDVIRARRPVTGVGGDDSPPETPRGG